MKSSTKLNNSQKQVLRDKKILLIGIAILAMLLTISSAAALTITDIGDQTANVGTEFTYQVTTDSSNPVTFSVTSGPGAMVDNTYKWTPTLANEGSNTVTISAKETANASENTTQTFTITVIADNGEFSAGDLKLGSENQARGQVISTIWTVTNTGDKTISGIEVETAPTSNSYNLSATLSKTSLAGGESLTVSVQSFVPWFQNSGINSIGTISIKGTGVNTLTKNVNLEAESKIRVKATFERTKGSDRTASDSRTITVDPFEQVNLIVEVENTYSDRDDATRNIEMDFDVDIRSRDLSEIDGERDTINNIQTNEQKTSTDFTFTLDPSNVDFNNAPFDVEIRVTAKDTNGAIHTKDFTVTLELDRATKDVRIADIIPSKTTINCDESKINLDVTLSNVGKRDLDQAVLAVEINDIDGRTLVRNLNINKGDEDTFRTTYTFPKNKKLEEGPLYLTVTAYPDNDLTKWTDSQVYELTVNACSGTTTTTTTTKPTTTTTTPTITTQTPGENTVTVTGTPVSSASGSSLFGVSGASSTYMIILGVIVLILIILVVILLIMLVRK